MSLVPARRLSQLPESENSGVSAMTGRVPAIPGGSSGSSSAALRGNYHPSTRCRTAVRSPVILLRCRVSGPGSPGNSIREQVFVTRSRPSGGARKRGGAKKLGASLCIDSKSTNAAEALQKLCGAQVILARRARKQCPR
jgi:hypothetical protein